jgi:hypothetical protein
MLEVEPELAEEMRKLARKRVAELEASGRAEPGRPTP